MLLFIVCCLSCISWSNSYISTLCTKSAYSSCRLHFSSIMNVKIFQRQQLNRLYSSVPYNRGTSGKQPALPPPPINQNIKATNVRLIISGNETADIDIMVGVMTLAEAQEYADKLQVDLVMINDKGDPPVCKAIDYGKFKYSLEKKKKENAKKQVQSEIKEIKMSYKIEQHDFDVRLKAIQKFIGEGDKVKVVVQFKGRELQYKDLGRELLLKIFQPLDTVAVMESVPKTEGKAYAMLLGPKKVV